jgi:hypothetical protein
VPFDRLKDAGREGATHHDLGPDSQRRQLLDATPTARRRRTPALIVGFDGLAEQVDWQCAELAGITGPLGGRGVLPLAGGVPQGGFAARASMGAVAAVVRFSVLPTLAAELMEQGAGVAKQRGLRTSWTAHAGVGVVTAALGSGSDRPDLKAVASVLGSGAPWPTGDSHATLGGRPRREVEVPVWDDLGAAAGMHRKGSSTNHLLNPSASWPGSGPRRKGP